jgi:hypothetical protein
MRKRCIIKGALPKCVKYTFYADHEQREPSNYGRECMIFRQESGNQQHALCLTKSREALHYRVRRSHSFSLETGENVNVSHFTSNRKNLSEFIKLNLFVFARDGGKCVLLRIEKNVSEFFKLNYSFLFATGEDASVSHFVSYRKKCKRNWRTLPDTPLTPPPPPPPTSRPQCRDFLYTFRPKEGGGIGRCAKTHSFHFQKWAVHDLGGLYARFWTSLRL